MFSTKDTSYEGGQGEGKARAPGGLGTPGDK